MTAPQWQPIETAPKDGTRIIVGGWHNTYDENGELDAVMHFACEIAYWWEDGTSWVERFGLWGKKIMRLKRTGVWSAGGGWFEPGEITHWMPLPEPPKETP